MLHRPIALLLAVSLVLAGCGSGGSVVTVPNSSLMAVEAPAAVAGAEPSVTVTQNAALPSVTTTSHPAAGAPVAAATEAYSSLRVVGAEIMADQEMADDAESQGYSVQAVADSTLGRPFDKTGVVRQTAAGFSLETSTGIFKKEYDSFVLAGTADMLSQLTDRANKKSKIKGVIRGTTVTVSSVKGALDLGFLTNWLTKGKISGTITDAVTKRPIEDVDVAVTSSEGYVFHASTDENGKFSVKTLQPGLYSVELSKTGYVGAGTDEAAPEEVKKRTNLKFVGELAPAN